jgi:hypothetical protein
MTCVKLNHTVSILYIYVLYIMYVCVLKEQALNEDGPSLTWIH